jgi:hypothetical protein
MDATGVWYAMSLGPPLGILAFTLTAVLILGFSGRGSLETTREWWSRLGAWFLIYAAGWALVCVAAIFAPLWLGKASETLTLAGIGGWLATTIAGLMAGNSPATDGKDSKKSATQLGREWIARFAPYVFVLGLIAGLGAGLHAFLVFLADALPPQDRYVDYYWAALNLVPWRVVGTVTGGLALVTLVYQLFLDINVFSLSNFYRNRLVWCYLGATRDKHDRDSFTNLSDGDDVLLSQLRHSESEAPFTGPFPIVNCALNLGGSSDLAMHTRQSASFTFTPLHAGCSRDRVGYAPLVQSGTPYYAQRGGGPTLGQAITISGAAASPNMGYHTSTVVAFLLTVFNVRLGGWFPNPGSDSAEKRSPVFSLVPLTHELFGTADERSGFLNLSDGGHFENLGIYELVRRRCRVIIAGDGECDPDLSFGSLGSVIRMCETDFGTRIDIDVSAIRKRPGTEFSESHAAIGKINYGDGTEGWLIYMKSSLTAGQETPVQQYKSEHAAFPHETTSDQFFSEDQFESYRLLGRSIALATFPKKYSDAQQDFAYIAVKLQQAFTPRLAGLQEFIGHTQMLDKLWLELSSDPGLHGLGAELFDRLEDRAAVYRRNSRKEYYYCLRLIQLMENLYLDLRWEETWEHPDNAGWRRLFGRCGASQSFGAAWKASRNTYGARFREFCVRQFPNLEK